MKRREFLTETGRILVLLPFGAFLLQCGGSSGDDDSDPTPPDAKPRVSGGNAFITSNRVNTHSHTFTIPLSGFESPPFGGIAGRTNVSQDHAHTLEVPEEAFRRAAEGEIVKIPTSTERDHQHIFSIVKVG